MIKKWEDPRKPGHNGNGVYTIVTVSWKMDLNVISSLEYNLLENIVWNHK